MSGYWDDLPDRKWSGDAISPRCPWCRDEISDLVIPLDALMQAHEHAELIGHGNWLYRGREFTGAACQCPRCEKPLLVKFVHDREALHSQARAMIIAPVRSETDVRFLSAKAGVS